ncbi:UbiA family prenyltransferase, putative [Aspergillus lentulus]|nr:UbiA family prenyltransferase, putative [Aspergillus lentulus]GFF93661.1 UbiA family prenyltransferase, putative [Aspergillus lentulus]
MKANTSIQEVMGPNLVLANTTPECHFLPSSKYTIPKTGLFAIMPQSWIPYAELMRLDRPAGYWAFYWHFAIGLALAASMSSPIPSPLILISLFLFFAVWVIVLRGAVCSWNDTLDQSFDRKVSRTRNRPIPRGAVSTVQAHLFTLAQIALGTAMLLPLPRGCMCHAALMTAILLVYPLGKRVTDFPQVILGIAFGMPIFLCGAALDADPLPLSGLYRLGTETDDLRLVAALCFYIASILWTVIFDTIYAHQDARDDANVGVRSLAVRLGDRTKQALSVLAATQVMLLLAAGVACNFSAIYFAGSCVGTAISLAALLWFVDLRHSASCAWWFCPGSHLVGASIVVGLLGEYCVNS